MKRVINNLQARHEIDNGRSNRKESADEHKEPASNHLLAHFQVGQFLVLFLELSLGIFLASKGLDQENTAYRERFLHHSAKRSQAFLCFFACSASYIAYLVGDPQKDRQQSKRYEREERTEVEHGYDRA